MATPPDRFGAHERGPAGFLSRVEQSFDSFSELLRLHVIGAAAERGVAPRSVARVRFGFSFPAQLREMFVADSMRAQRFRQRVLIELWITPGPWPRAHVGQQ